MRRHHASALAPVTWQALSVRPYRRRTGAAPSRIRFCVMRRFSNRRAGPSGRRSLHYFLRVPGDTFLNVRGPGSPRQTGIGRRYTQEETRDVARAVLAEGNARGINSQCISPNATSDTQT